MPGEIQFRNKLDCGNNRGPELRNRIVGVAGRKGSGKSTLTAEILRNCYRQFVFDTMGEHSWIPDQHRDLAEAELYIYEHGSSAGEFIGSYTPENDFVEADFQTICTAVFEVGNLTLVVEELPMLSQPNYVPPRFDKLIRLGRHRSVNILYTGQRLSECPRRVTAATDVFVLFSHTEPRDLDAIAERCSPEIAIMVSNLGDHEFLVWDVASRSVILVDSRWYTSLLNTEQAYTPAIGGKSGRSVLWSLEENA
jgi:hypothetical protein